MRDEGLLDAAEGGHGLELGAGDVGLAVAGAAEAGEAGFEEPEHGAPGEAVLGDGVVDGNQIGGWWLSLQGGISCSASPAVEPPLFRRA